MRKLTFIDLFAGCGGLSLGLMQAGWSGIFAIEKSADAFKTLSHNLCNTKSIYKFAWPEWLPCKNIEIDKLLSDYHGELFKLRGKIDLIAGGPPCQGFSQVGLRNPNDPRNKLTSQYIRVVDIIRPRYLLLENVRGFQTAFKNRKQPYSLQVKNKLEKLEWGGYQVYSKLINASNFGVPQPRPRFIMLAVRKDIAPLQAEPFEYILNTVHKFRKSKGLNGHHISVKEAISDLEIKKKKLIPSSDSKGFFEIKYSQPIELTGYQKLMRKNTNKNLSPNSLRLPNHKPDTVEKFTSILKKCPKGKNMSAELKKTYKMKKQCFVPLHPDMLARTVTTLPDDSIHYNEPRVLTVREMARLQSFPDWFSFQGKYTTGGDRRKIECPRYTQVGNAVPPLMAEAIGSALLGLIKNGKAKTPIQS